MFTLSGIYKFKPNSPIPNLYKRLKHKETHWSVQKKKKNPCDKALDHFDEFYNQVFGKNWPSIRHGLLSKQKYIAVVNNFGDTEETRTTLERIGALNIRTLFHLEKRYIGENYEKLRRKKRMDEIFKMDRDMEKNLRGSVVKEDTSETVHSSHSLEQDLLNAEIDFSRVISSENAGSVNLSEFMPVTRLKGKEDWIPEHGSIESFGKIDSFGNSDSDSDSFSKNNSYSNNFDNSNSYANSDFTVSVTKEYDLHFPEHLNVYSYEIGNHDEFNAPKNGKTGVLNYYLMDGGSLLPILALDIKPGDKILDMCASPGGKSYLAIQTLYPDKIVCNDVTKGRTDRIYNVMRQYLYDFEEKWLDKGKLRISLADGRYMEETTFDKIIVDVPCTTDRHSLKESENNIFRPDRIKERLKLPELQSELLVRALKLVRVGGNVVYSTCSLSPIQNDGVVHMALKKIWEETDIEVSVKDLNIALLQTASVYKLAERSLVKYGHLVIPNLQVNFGPTYFCKLQRIK